jgi:hypothetical protein
MRARLDRQVALDVDVALELSGDADVARAFDLAFDDEARGDDGFFRRRIRAILRHHGTGGRLAHGSEYRDFFGCLWGGFRHALLPASLIIPQRHDEPPELETRDLARDRRT